MNSIHPEPPKPKKKKGLKLRIRVAVQRPKRRKLNFPPVTVPGTPEEETKKEEGIDDDLDLYYKVYSRYKPERIQRGISCQNCSIRSRIPVPVSEEEQET
jgi:hypothetical protein